MAGATVSALISPLASPHHSLWRIKVKHPASRTVLYLRISALVDICESNKTNEEQKGNNDIIILFISIGVRHLSGVSFNKRLEISEVILDHHTDYLAWTVVH